MHSLVGPAVLQDVCRSLITAGVKSRTDSLPVTDHGTLCSTLVSCVLRLPLTPFVRALACSFFVLLVGAAAALLSLRASPSHSVPGMSPASRISVLQEKAILTELNKFLRKLVAKCTAAPVPMPNGATAGTAPP